MEVEKKEQRTGDNARETTTKMNTDGEPETEKRETIRFSGGARRSLLDTRVDEDEIRSWYLLPAEVN